MTILKGISRSSSSKLKWSVYYQKRTKLKKTSALLATWQRGDDRKKRFQSVPIISDDHKRWTTCSSTIFSNNYIEFTLYNDDDASYRSFSAVSNYHPLVSGGSSIPRKLGLDTSTSITYTSNLVTTSTFHNRIIQRSFSTNNVGKKDDNPTSNSSNSVTATSISNSSSFTTSSSTSLAALEAMNKRYLFQYLNLKTYTDEEIDDAFDQIVQKGRNSSKKNNDNQDESNTTSVQKYVNEHNLTAFLLDRIKDIDNHQQKASSHDDHDDNFIISKERQNEMQYYANAEAKRIILLLQQNNNEQSIPKNSIDTFLMDKQTFQQEIRNLATKIDTSHTLPIAISMLLVGSSVGIVIPIMPYVVSNLGLSAGQYGMVVSSFAFAKLFANVPAAVFVEKHGRKPHLVYSLIIISVGVGGIGLANQFEHLVLCRVLTGIGVSSLSTAATLANADSSTPLNRASTMAPMMSAFAAGTALGPVMGGVLADRVGIQSTFFLVGCSYLALTAVNNMTLNETKLPMLKERQLPWNNSSMDDDMKKHDAVIMKEKKKKHDRGDESIIGAMKDATSQWLPLLQIKSVRNVVVMNGFYWIALSGSQMTLLPLILTNPDGLAFTATQVGQGKPRILCRLVLRSITTEDDPNFTLSFPLLSLHGHEFSTSSW